MSQGLQLINSLGITKKPLATFCICAVHRVISRSQQIVWGDSANPTSPAVVPLSPDNLIIRMGSIDQGKYVQDGSQNFTNYNDLLQRNNTDIGVTASYGQVNEGASVGDLNFSLSPGESDGSHNRTFSIEPYEFRFAVANVTSSVCTNEQVTLSVTDKAGTPLPWGFRGTVDLSPTSSTGGEVGALWSGGSGGLSTGDDGIQTYTFDGTEGSTITLNYSNPNVGIVDFDIAFGNFSESTNYTAPTLDVLVCDTASLAHYHIDIPATGLACLTSNVTVTGHDSGHNDVPIPDGTLLTLTTSNGSGSWVNTVGSGTLTDPIPLTDGQGTYELTGGAETSI